jgi:activator of HSP90 ATPase
MKTKDINQEIFIKTTPSVIYHAFMDSKTHSKFTGDTAQIGKNIGDNFSAFSGYATGKNIQLKPNELIIQSWRASDWPKDHFSTIQIKLKSQKDGTLITFNQTGVPETQCDDISKGWYDYYWKPLKSMFDK